MNSYRSGNGLGPALSGGLRAAPAHGGPEFGATVPGATGSGGPGGGRGVPPALRVFLGELGELTGEFESPLHEAEEMELAAELLEVHNEQELEQFLGSLFKKVAGGLGKFLSSGVGRAVGGVLKNVAKVALPLVGGAVGSFVAPGVGTALGGRLGSMASSLFGKELEQVGELELEFEVARRYVRLSAAAARNATFARSGGNPDAAGRAAVLAAARRYAPGLYRRFPRFVRPTPWYWPEPVPVAYPVPEQLGWQEPFPAGGPVVPDSHLAFPDGQPVPPDGESMFGVAPDGQPASQARGMAVPSPFAGTLVPGPSGGQPRSGRWVRRGRKIIILGT